MKLFRSPTDDGAPEPAIEVTETGVNIIEVDDTPEPEAKKEFGVDDFEGFAEKNPDAALRAAARFMPDTPAVKSEPEAKPTKAFDAKQFVTEDGEIDVDGISSAVAKHTDEVVSRAVKQALDAVRSEDAHTIAEVAISRKAAQIARQYDLDDAAVDILEKDMQGMTAAQVRNLKPQTAEILADRAENRARKLAATQVKDTATPGQTRTRTTSYELADRYKGGGTTFEAYAKMCGRSPSDPKFIKECQDEGVLTKGGK